MVISVDYEPGSNLVKRALPWNPVSFESLLGSGSVRRDLLVRSGLPLRPSGSVEAAARTAKRTRIFTGAGVFGPQILPGLACGFGAGGAGGKVDFAIDSGEFGGDFLTERRTVEFEQTFNLFIGEVLVVDSYQLFVHGIGVKFLLKFGQVIVGESLRAVGVGGAFHHLLAVLFCGGAGGVLNGVLCADQFEQSADIRFLGRINRLGENDFRAGLV